MANKFELYTMKGSVVTPNTCDQRHASVKESRHTLRSVLRPDTCSLPCITRHTGCLGTGAGALCLQPKRQLRTAGTESTAKTTSESSTTARASRRGVAMRTPLTSVKKRSPSYWSDTEINRLWGQITKDMGQSIGLVKVPAGA